MKKLLLGLIVFLFGFMGILSMLTMTIPLPEEAIAILSEHLTEGQIKLVVLINPTLLLLFSVVIGTALFQQTGFKIPIIEKFLALSNRQIETKNILYSSLKGGVIAGVLLSLSGAIANTLFFEEMNLLSESIVPSTLSRLLYGGITEEILMRFGLMSLVTWIFIKLSKSDRSWIYWTSILFAALVFAIGHLPIVFTTIPEPNFGLISYILIGNSIGGTIFGWLYWKKGLESAILAHMITHVVMLLLEYFI